MTTLTEMTFKLVGNSPLFSSLDEDVLNRLLSEAPLVTFANGKVVIREGDPGEAMFLIKTGMARVYTTREDQEIELAVLGPGACIGEVATLTGQPRTATVITMQDSELLRFSKRSIDDILEMFPKVKKRLESLVLGRARDTIEKTTRH